MLRLPTNASLNSADMYSTQRETASPGQMTAYQQICYQDIFETNWSTARGQMHNLYGTKIKRLVSAKIAICNKSDVQHITHSLFAEGKYRGQRG